MMGPRKNNKNLAARSALILFLVCVLNLPTMAQQNVSANDNTIEEIIVTGSRIPRAGFDTVAPAIVVDQQFIEDRGFTDIASVLNEIPAFGQPAMSTQSKQGYFAIGQNYVDFFGIGSNRTLTVVNGRRFVATNPPAPLVSARPGLQVDLNLIPASLIDRVETIAIGGAPIYGADAIAGTVNVIMKRDFEGFDISASYGVSEVGEMAESKLALAWGKSTSDGRGNFVVSVEYTDRAGMIETDMDHHKAGWFFADTLDPEIPYTRVLTSDKRLNLATTGGVATPTPFLAPNFGFGSYDDGSYLRFAPDGSLVDFDVGEPTANFTQAIGGDGLFIESVRSLFTPLERILFTGLGHYELTEGIEVFGEVWAARTDATALAHDPAYQSAFFSGDSGPIFFPIDHPLLTPTAQTTLAGLTFDGAPIPGFWIQRASTDLDPTNNSRSSEVDFVRLVGGLQGEFGALNRSFTWDVSYNFGRSTNENSDLLLHSQRFLYALDVIPDPVSGELGCRVVIDPSSRPTDPSTSLGPNWSTSDFNECVPLDIFGEGRASQESINYVNAKSQSRTEIEQKIFLANVGSDLIKLPAGVLGVAAGFEHREESSDFDPGTFLEFGLGREAPITPVSGEYKTNEFYAEFHAPLVSDDMDIPFLNSASLEGAWRTVDNSLAGTDSTWSVGGRFAPVSQIEFRGNVTQSVRSPGILEQFMPLVSVMRFADDPCDQRFINDGSNPAVRRENCVSGGGHLPPIPDPDNFLSIAADVAVQGVAGGDPTLQNEAADAWSAGVVFRPDFAGALQIAVDYVNIEVSDAIEWFSLDDVMQSCYDQVTFPNRFCDSFQRQSDGQLPQTGGFSHGFVNAGKRTFRGVTAELQYSTDLYAGQLDVSASVLNLREDVLQINDFVQDSTGEVGQAEWQANITLRYSQNDWSAMLQPRFIGGGPWSNDDAPMARDIMGEGDVWIVNGAFMYEINESVHLQFNINNLFDNLPSPGSIAAGKERIYDDIGRYFRLGLQVRL